MPTSLHPTLDPNSSPLITSYYPGKKNSLRLQLMKAIVLAESSILYFIFSPRSLCYKDIYRHELGRYRTLPLFLTFHLSRFFFYMDTFDYYSGGPFSESPLSLYFPQHFICLGCWSTKTSWTTQLFHSPGLTVATGWRNHLSLSSFKESFYIYITFKAWRDFPLHA